MIQHILLSVRSVFFCLLLVCGVASTSAIAEVGLDIVIGVPPPPVRVEVVPEPRPGLVWAPGYWRWEGNLHVWEAGHWLEERPGHRWVPEHWEERGGRHHFHPGRWEPVHERGEREQERREERREGR